MPNTMLVVVGRNSPKLDRARPNVAQIWSCRRIPDRSRTNFGRCRADASSVPKGLLAHPFASRTSQVTGKSADISSHPMDIVDNRGHACKSASHDISVRCVMCAKLCGLNLAPIGLGWRAGLGHRRGYRLSAESPLRANMLPCPQSSKLRHMAPPRALHVLMALTPRRASPRMWLACVGDLVPAEARAIALMSALGESSNGDQSDSLSCSLSRYPRPSS